MMFNNRVDIFEENKRLREELEHQKKQCKEWQEKYYELFNELKKTQALLLQFLNENTPSSKLPYKLHLTENKDEPKARGKPEGSNGGAKELPEQVDRRLKAKLGSKCRRCGREIRRKKIDTRIRYVYDAKIVAEIIEVEEEFYPCDCGELCTGEHPDIPPRGMIGYNLQSLFTELKFNFSGSYGNISSFFNNVTEGKINFSPTAINDCLVGVAEKLEPSYNEIEEKIAKEDYAYSDETSWPVNGERWYLWLFVTLNFVYITIQNSRAKRVLINVFGEDYHGGIISDCYKAYDGFAEWFQKCWAHLLRKAKFESEKHPRKNVVKLYGQLCRLHQEMSDFLKENPSKKRRLKAKKRFEKKLNKIMNYKRWCPEAQSIVDNRLKAYRNHWLTAIEVEGISLDNNLCERKIRRSIGWRKMLGGHRTEKGAKQYAIIQTLRETWKHQEKRPYDELLNALRN